MGSKVSHLVLSIACLALASCQPLQSLIAPTPTSTPHGVTVDPPRQMPDFTLTDHDGKPMKLSNLRGKAVLIFFGYTHCPDICPLSLADFRLVKNELGDDAQKINFVMISVDGSRDTPEVMKRYVKAFDPGFIGLTGDEVTVRKIGINYGVHFEKQEPTGTAAAYLVAHTSYTYLLDAEGEWRMVFPFKTPAESVAADVRQVLTERQ
ncbi:MAG: SCO family protein [Chloroflexi bacterium]|nr:SCO family protein [Chloroflexota bacterium]